MYRADFPSDFLLTVSVICLLGKKIPFLFLFLKITTISFFDEKNVLLKNLKKKILVYCQQPPDICSLRKHAGVEGSFR
jgi:hypothetical protein